MSAPRRPSRSVDEIIHDWNISQFGPDTETFPPQRLHDEYGRCWPHQTKNVDMADIDDIIARYVERLTAGRDPSTGVSLELLQKHGYTGQD